MELLQQINETNKIATKIKAKIVSETNEIATTNQSKKIVSETNETATKILI